MNAHIKPIRDQVLDHLKDRRPQPVSLIAAALDKEPTNIHRIVKDLCDAGLLIGETGPGGAIYYERVDNDTGLDREKPNGSGAAPRDTTNPAGQAETKAAPPPPLAAPRRKRSRLSTDDFMVTLKRLQSDSDRLARIREILEEPDAED